MINDEILGSINITGSYLIIQIHFTGQNISCVMERTT